MMAPLPAAGRGGPGSWEFVGDAWSQKVTRQLGLEHTTCPRGRPRKEPVEQEAGKMRNDSRPL